MSNIEYEWATLTCILFNEIAILFWVIVIPIYYIQTHWILLNEIHNKTILINKLIILLFWL